MPSSDSRAPLVGLVLALGLALVPLAGCRDTGEIPTGEELRPYAPPGQVTGPSREIQVRNSCPEAVELVVARELPGATAERIQVRSTRVETLEVGPGARVWLRRDGGYDERYSVLATGAIEVGFQCDAIYVRDRGIGGGR